MPGWATAGVGLPGLPGALPLAFVGHTVAARLFHEDLLAHHLESCAEGSALIQVRRLAYSRRFGLVPMVRDAIAGDVEIV